MKARAAADVALIQGNDGRAAAPGVRPRTGGKRDLTTRRLLYTEEQRGVLAAVQRLPARQREVVVLRYYIDMTEEQAARAMGVSRGTVKSATSRAVAAVGRMLKGES